MPISRFSSDLEGWTTSNATQTFSDADGNPGGNLRGIEGASGVWYFDAPDAYLGDKSAFCGGSLSFDLRQDIATSQFDEADIILIGNGGQRLVVDFGDNPGTDWTPYSVRLALGGGWHNGSLTGSVSSEDQIRAVLANLESVQIRGEFVNGTAGDASNLDNVKILKTPAEPPEIIGARAQSTFDSGIDGWSFVADVKNFNWVGTGGKSNDILTAAAAAPTRSSASHPGNDREKIDLSRVSSIADFNDLTDDQMDQIGADVVINALDGNTITLVNTQMTDLHGADFLF